MNRINPAIAIAASVVAAAAGLFAARALVGANETERAVAPPLVIQNVDAGGFTVNDPPTVQELVVVNEQEPPTEKPAADQNPEVVAQDAPVADAEAAAADIDAAVRTFVADFSAAHGTNEPARLVSTLHPAMNEAFGEDACTGYVEATVGSIADMGVVSVGEPTDFTLESPVGDITLFGAVPVTASWTVVHSGESQNLLFHLAAVEGELRWLTTCGWHPQGT